MPFIETTMIAGYSPDVKKRLITALTRAVRSVMAAPLEGVIVVLREVDPSCWARGGVSRVPGAAMPDPLEVVVAYADAVANGDVSAASAVAANLTHSQPAAAYHNLVEAYTDDGSLVFAEGAARDVGPVMDRFLVRAGKIVEIRRWTPTPTGHA